MRAGREVEVSTAVAGSPGETGQVSLSATWAALRHARELVTSEGVPWLRG